MAIDCLPPRRRSRPCPMAATVCPTCVAMGSTWVNLRQCLACGQVGCCDSSPNTHATKHHETTGHPIIRSIMPGQDWMWCYLDELTFRERDGEHRAGRRLLRRRVVVHRASISKPAAGSPTSGPR